MKAFGMGEIVTHMWEIINEYETLVRKLRGQRPHGRLDTIGKIILKCI
jgi:hypothetical protein